ncbi:DNA translocase FtsK 4TM domain-containing protein [Vibrio salinus]|uniref:DNA translocase FtsK 4TM domain-containing protein n=1 Tax=Vibrio salinus TaxID=2899784 RepID=UPI001E334BA6|nr:DNA translocase FtsK 4TM domain-containing protein [Vibrio salinus]MCE0492874.1 DNA translocase FtsK 4TM domain-containing protein [Vibrio salinus]
MFKENENKLVNTIIKTKPQADNVSRLNGIQRLRECGFIFTVLISIFFAISLFTFSPADPSWSQTAWGGQLHNAGGFIGAWIGDTLFFSFGLLAYPLPFLIVLGGWILLRSRSEEEFIDFMLWGTRLLGLFILLLTSCGLADINFDDLWYFSSGGVVGDVITSLALPTFNLLGSTLILLFFWGAGFTLLTGISWLKIVDALGEQAIKLVSLLVKKIRGRRDEDLYLQIDTSQADLSLEEKIAEKASAMQLEKENEKEVEDLPSSFETEVQNEQRRFSIHMPDFTKSDEALTESRSKQLDVTIEELEQHAIEEDDYAEQLPSVNNIDEASSVAEYTGTETEPDSSVIDIDDEAYPTMSSLPDVDDETDDNEEDKDVVAFQNIVEEAQQASVAQQNPFLIRPTESLPKPTEPMPTLELLYSPETRENFIDKQALEDIARLVEAKLADYKIHAEVVGIYPGPVITRFELDLAPGVKVSRISGLSMDLARSLSAAAVRVVEVIPGKPYVGLELPNTSRQTVYLSDVISSEKFVKSKSPTTVVLGEDIAGEAVVADLAKMPHVLVAGTTGSGKSVGVNVMILSMLYKSTPEDVRFIMIDPKMLELSIYEGIPHLLSEVVTDMKDASNALRWCVAEMERRYKLMSVVGVRNVKGFNEKLKMAAEAGHPIHDPLWKEGDSMDAEPPLLEKLPYIVVIVDEFADLMMVVGKKVEELIARLAQKARAAGIHLVLATQRPSVDVITGLIKANIPTRVAFTVSTKTDSRTILDQGGAESLLGMGDMLYLPPGSSHTIRVHGAFASDDDVHAVVNNWKARGKPNYISEITNGDQGPDALLPGEKMEEDEDVDPLFDQVVEYIVESRRGSVSGVQRRFKIGYNRAARIVEQLEVQGIVSAPGHNGNREVLAPEPNRHNN